MAGLGVSTLKQTISTGPQSLQKLSVVCFLAPEERLMTSCAVSELIIMNQVSLGEGN